MISSAIPAGPSSRMYSSNSYASLCRAHLFSDPDPVPVTEGITCTNRVSLSSEGNGVLLSAAGDGLLSLVNTGFGTAVGSSNRAKLQLGQSAGLLSVRGAQL